MTNNTSDEMQIRVNVDKVTHIENAVIGEMPHKVQLTQIVEQIFAFKDKQAVKTMKVAVLMGGMSSERAVSFESGKGVLKALLEKGYQAFALDVCRPISALIKALEIQKPDVVFNALHGKYGEDGCVQGILNMMCLPYTHSGVLASALSMDKNATKEIAKRLGVDVAQGMLITKEEIAAGGGLPFPYVLKPNDEGSSVGVYIVTNEIQEAQVLAEWPFQKPVLTEEYIAGRELSVAVTDEQALGIVDIVPQTGFYDYKHKYTKGGADHIIPAILQKEVEEKLKTQALSLHHAVGCKGVSRSDFRFDEQRGRLVFLEINANPGMTPFSLVPEIAAAKGIEYSELVELLIQKADFER